MKTTFLLMTVAEMERDPETWLTLRKTYITGTDAGTIMGVNPWKNAPNAVPRKARRCYAAGCSGF